MLFRMKMAGELVSPALGLYTTANHPCLAHPTVPIVPDIGSSSSFVQRTSFVQNRFGEDSLLERTDANELSHLPPPGTKLGEEPCPMALIVE